MKKLRQSELKRVAAMITPAEQLYEVTVTIRFVMKPSKAGFHEDGLGLEEAVRSVLRVTDTIHAGRRVNGYLAAKVLDVPPLKMKAQIRERLEEKRLNFGARYAAKPSDVARIFKK